MDDYASGFSLSERQIDHISQLLSEMGNRIPARYLLLVENSGHVVAEWGHRGRSNPISLGALVAGDMMAALELARMTGEDASYQLVLREGRDETAFLAQAGSKLILMALIHRDVPGGWARLLISRATGHLKQVLEWQETSATPADAELDANNLEKLFETALDDLWTGADGCSSTGNCENSI